MYSRASFKLLLESVVIKSYVSLFIRVCISSISLRFSSAVLDLSAGDYIEIYGKVDVNSGTANIYGATASNSRYTVLHIFKLVE